MTLCTYLLPIRRKVFSEHEATELREYLSILRAADCEVLVVDGSPAEVFAQYKRAWSAVCRHEMVDPRFHYLNDKVNGIHTGVNLAATEKIILADDDIRYIASDIDKICLLLDDFEVVRPQNYLCPLPWWAKMEAARMLINRATLRTADYPGACAFRRSTMLSAGEYDGDVLFDNEEIIRHFARAGARICNANDFFIRKRPPKFRKWIEQRPRQAYEDFGLRFKTILFASLLPIGIAIVLIDLKWMAILLLSIVFALAGWLRGNARRYFPFNTCLFAPLWVVERAVSTWWAFYWYFRHGGYPFGDRLITKGIGRDWIEGGKMAAHE
ncbi:MAG: glycosyltransferase family 2 protein [Verrucomicrobiota bacterium]|nr:glycosyltransferase family 2 protein [Verrucomicrobiota bacterium]